MALARVIFNTARYELHARGGAELSREFTQREYVKLPGFISDEGLQLLRSEVERMQSIARRRDFTMETMGSSPRHMVTVGGKGITEASGVLPMLYRDPDLLAFIGGVFGEPTALVDDLTERHVVNILEGIGDTHGAHFDDFPIALVMFLESPPPGAGGEVEFVPAATSLSDLNNGRVQRERHEAGDAYILKADTAAHRVAPLNRPARRVAINMAFARPGATATTTNTASLLYD